MIIQILKTEKYFASSETEFRSTQVSENDRRVSDKPFYQDFLFGVATSAYQAEGAWDLDGKGYNNYDHFYHKEKQMSSTPFDVAADSYHMYMEDVEIISQLGFQVYSFSISWSRVLPNGRPDQINPAGVLYYHRLIDELLKRGIEPMITMYYRDLPHALNVLAAWRNYRMADYMIEYADFLFSTYGKKVKYWITMNDPLSICLAYVSKEDAGSYLFVEKEDIKAFYLTARSLLWAHGKVYRLYDEKYRASQNGLVSIAINTDYYLPNSIKEKDVKATKRIWNVNVDMFADPIYSKTGDFPKFVKEIYKELGLSQFTWDQIHYIRGSSDFFSCNHYQTWLCAAAVAPNGTRFKKIHNDIIFLKNQSWPVSYGNFSVVPWGLRETLLRIKRKYDSPPIFVTENGYSGRPGVINDTDRLLYHRDYLKELDVAKNKDGCNVFGYTVWSLVDVPDWRNHYNFTFGIVSVNSTDPKRKRKIKISALYFKKFIKSGIFPIHLFPKES